MNFSLQKFIIPQKPLHAFTLVELLVVIAIIAILMGLIFPAATGAMNSAKKTAAKNQVVQIATAINAFETEYGKLPSFTGTNMNASNVAILTANDTTNNPRALNFLDTSAWKIGKGGTNANGYCDPFNSNSAYAVRLDTNYNNTLTTMPIQASGSGTVTYTNTLTKHIGVWTVWTNGSQFYLINSWD